MDEKKYLHVMDVVVKCPHDQGFGEDGAVNLRDCFMDSVTEGTVCSSVYLGGQCNKIADWRSVWRWRSHYVWPKLKTDHIPCPVRIYYAPITPDGRRWMAINAMSGERKEVDLSPVSEIQPGDKLALVNRRLNRKTIDGALLREPYTGWVGGGDIIQNHLWCDCAICTSLRPKHYEGKDHKTAYRDSLEPDLRKYWDAALSYSFAKEDNVELVKRGQRTPKKGGPFLSIQYADVPVVARFEKNEEIPPIGVLEDTLRTQFNTPRPMGPGQKAKAEKIGRMRERHAARNALIAEAQEIINLADCYYDQPKFVPGKNEHRDALDLIEYLKNNY